MYIAESSQTLIIKEAWISWLQDSIVSSSTNSEDIYTKYLQVGPTLNYVYQSKLDSVWWL